MDFQSIKDLFSGKSAPKGDPTHRRTAERHAVDGLQCTLGAVIDLSRTGMRIWTTREPRAAIGMAIPMVLADGDQRVSISGKVMWVRKLDDETGWHIGMAFDGADDVFRQAIETYTKAGYFTTDPSIRRKLYSGESNFETQPEPQTPVIRAEVVDLYEVIGVDRAASAEEIHLAYKRLARKLHPDQCDEADAAERFSRVAKAYSVLRDAASRAKYDQLLMGRAA